MSTTSELKALGVAVDNPSAILRFVAGLPVPRTERIRLLRGVEQDTGRFFDPRDFARAVDGIPPS